MNKQFYTTTLRELRGAFGFIDVADVKEIVNHILRSSKKVEIQWIDEKCSLTEEEDWFLSFEVMNWQSCQQRTIMEKYSGQRPPNDPSIPIRQTIRRQTGRRV